MRSERRRRAEVGPRKGRYRLNVLGTTAVVAAIVRTKSRRQAGAGLAPESPDRHGKTRVRPTLLLPHFAANQLAGSVVILDDVDVAALSRISLHQR
jgi:hypothetical protein